jgi:hypothetical protein
VLGASGALASDFELMKLSRRVHAVPQLDFMQIACKAALVAVIFG